jgi:hypothetical protein
MKISIFQVGFCPLFLYEVVYDMIFFQIKRILLNAKQFRQGQ